ncbi:ABC transporter permease [Brachybacterium sp. p3-SID957]|uniref:ABC transporter permease n=1 Tax=Brachybacterium sp. p3-SID957 TaxID=2916049 RepID=UPI00223ABC7A|nr:ABC transporter permease [Brachybacterium sp. p3-SID957]MCT1775629.1 ABC transporter permease [Brachybacterium sp. p3-SID957]
MTPVRGHRTPGGSLLPGWVRVLGLLCVAVLALPIVGLLSTVHWSTLGQSLTAPSALIALRLSLLTALAATVLSLLVGLPVALLMARAPAGSMLLRVARTLVLLPLVLPPVVGGIALLSTYGRRGLVGPLAEALGIDIAFTTLAVVLAQTFVAAPFLILTVEGALRSRGTAYEATALTLGASPTRTLATITLPLLAQSLGAGLVLTFARALGEFGATITFAGSLQGTTRTLPLEIYLARETDQDSAVAMSLLLVIVAAVIVAIAYRSPGAEGLRRSLGRTSSADDTAGAPAGAPADEQTDVEEHTAPATPAALTTPSSPALDARIVVPERGVDLALHVPAGQTLAIVGPNGSGKSTVIEVLAGLVTADDGHIRLGDDVLLATGRASGTEGTEPSAARPGVTTVRPRAPHLRRVARLGQHPLLFPHLTLEGNAAFGPRAEGAGRSASRDQARTWLDRVGVGRLASRRPYEVSGGQAQRAAIARALATSPQLSLWDEPFAALDVQSAPQLRELLARELAGRTAVIVTHDLADLRALADRVMVLEAGRVRQDVPLEEFLQRPAPGFAQHLVASE